MAAEKLTDDIVNQLKGWKAHCEESRHELKIFAGLDVGGTNARLALARSDKPVDDFLIVAKFRASDAATLLRGLAEIAAQISALNIINGHVIAGCVAAAGPVGDQQVVVTNYHEPRTIRAVDLPPLFFPPGHTMLLNDLEGTCEGISALGSLGKLSAYFRPLWTSEKEEHVVLNPRANYAVLAMGTGLGTAALVRAHAKLHHKVLPLEMGHTHITPLGVSHPDYARDRELLEYLSTSVWHGQYPPENEDVCSGRGLVRCYDFVTRHHPDAAHAADPGDVARLAHSGDATASEAMLIHYRYLLRTAQYMTVGLQTKGVFLAGDNQVANDPFVSKHVKELEREFKNHQKHDWVEPVSVYRQTASYNLNLLGCIFSASRIV